MPGVRKPIFVQATIRAPLERVWELTQIPDLHRRWDLRFTEIEYLPRPSSDAPQRFQYATRIGFGLCIRGEGETVGDLAAPNGERTSALRFASDDPKSLIREGSGYWKYVPVPATGDGPPAVRFLTAYDYITRFGAAGRLFDRLAFRPLMSWATAWSFDRLRLWIERGLDPAEAMRRSVVHAVARIALAIVWLYHGLVPKLLVPQRDELEMLRDAGLSDASAAIARTGMGWAELALGAILLLAWHARWPLWITLAAMPLATLGVCAASPRFLVAAFNPVSFNLCVFALAAIGLLAGGDDLPSARRCLRRPPREDA